VKILDTDVCVEILRGSRQVVARRCESLGEVATCWITAAELSYAAAKSRAPATSQNLVIEVLATLPEVDLTLLAGEQSGRYKVSLWSARATRWPMWTFSSPPSLWPKVRP
jgi:tRNA(fMet)-specific endonuclease VapC